MREREERGIKKRQRGRRERGRQEKEETEREEGEREVKGAEKVKEGRRGKGGGRRIESRSVPSQEAGIRPLLERVFPGHFQMEKKSFQFGIISPRTVWRGNSK